MILSKKRVRVSFSFSQNLRADGIGCTAWQQRNGLAAEVGLLNMYLGIVAAQSNTMH
jgi:hypothetical protein